jgi:hypothetical protein
MNNGATGRHSHKMDSHRYRWSLDATMHLERPAVQAVLREVGRCAPGSVLGFDYVYTGALSWFLLGDDWGRRRRMSAMHG